MDCLKTFDSFCFQIVLSNGDSDVKNDTWQSTKLLSRIYVGVIRQAILDDKLTKYKPCMDAWG